MVDGISDEVVSSGSGWILTSFASLNTVIQTMIMRTKAPVTIAASGNQGGSFIF